ncbi:VCBS domain-containing protein, partial [Vibrio ostreicida]|uniref:VCBS domain-containing protein n=1 Tax=Vibrio ostreicida TaxID=526588 RepID=UPI001C4D71F1
ALSTGGTLTATDVDNPDNQFNANTLTGEYGTFAIDANGAWTFTANSAFNELNVGDHVNETFNVSSVDGTLSTVTVTIQGTNDAASVSSASVTLTESDAALSTGGTLTATDVDNPDNQFNANTHIGEYGTFAIDANGVWTFTANSAFDELNVGDQVQETFAVTSIDGTASSVTVTIQGTNDAASVSSASVTLTESDAALSTGGTLTATDVDNPDNQFTANTHIGEYGTFAID